MRVLKGVWFFLVALFLAGPLIVVAGVSVNEKQSLTFPPEGFSLSWYGQIFTDDGWRAALFSSLLLAACAAALAVAIALPLAWFLWRRIAPWANVFQLLGVAPFILPPVITALGFLTFWATVGAYGQPWTAVISHAIFFVTLPLVTLSLGFSAIDRSLVEAAQIDGAGRWKTFRYVTMPAIMPTITIVLVLSLIQSIKAFDIVYGLTGGGPSQSTQMLALWAFTQSMQIFDFGRGGAISVILLLITVVIVIPYLRWSMKNEGRS